MRNSAQQIWQAGLGAFAKAQQEGGKVFSKLVKEGGDLQKRTRKIAEEKVSGVTDRVTRVAGGVREQATGSLDKLEQVFEERVSRALTSMGVPTQKDIQLLTRRVEQLSKAVAELSGKKAAREDAESKPLAKKPVAKKAAKPAAVEEVAVVAEKKPATRKRKTATDSAPPAAAPAKPRASRKRATAAAETLSAEASAATDSTKLQA